MYSLIFFPLSVTAAVKSPLNSSPGMGKLLDTTIATIAVEDLTNSVAR